MFFLILLPVSGFCQEEEPADTTAPTGSMVIEGGETYTTSRSISIILSADDSGGTGVAGYYLSEDNTKTPSPTYFTPASSTQMYNQTVSFQLSEGDGAKAVYVWFVDVAENISAAFSDSITLDQTAPGDVQTSINDASGFVSTSLVTVILSANDLTGIEGYYLSENSETPSAFLFETIDPATTSVNYNVPFTLSKNAGLKTIYAWLIDVFGHISAPVSANVDLSYGWVRVIGTDMWDGARSITMDMDGNSYVVGYTDGDHSDDLYPVKAFVSKVSPSGDIIWTGTVGEEATFNTSAEHVAVDGYGNVFIGGSYNIDTTMDFEYRTDDAFIAKFDADGNRQWLNIYEGSTLRLSRINGIGVDSSNNLYTIGYTNGILELSDTVTISFSEGSGNFLAKYDGNGNLQWGTDLYPEESGGDLLSGNGGFSVDDSGNIFIAGTANDGFDGQTGYGSWDILLAKFNSNGEKQWTKLHGTVDIESCWDLFMDSYGKIYVTGSIREAGANNFKGYAKKFDSNGDHIWTKDIPTAQTDDKSLSPKGISVDSKGNVYVIGTISVSYGEDTFPDLFIKKYSDSGLSIWTKRIATNEPSSEEGSDIYIGPRDMVYAVGSIYNYYVDNGFAGQQSNGAKSDGFIWKSAPDDLLDTIHPVFGALTINGGNETSALQTITLNLNTTDNIGVTGYAVSEGGAIPPPSAFTLIEETATLSEDVQYTFENADTGTKKVYVWYRDAFGNFSKAASASIDYTGDIDAPVGETPVIDGGKDESQSTTVSVEISATDNVAVTGYCLTEGSNIEPAIGDFTIINTPSPDFTKTVSFTLQNTTAGPFSIYVWFIDAAENISDPMRGGGDMADTRPPITTIDPPFGYYDGPVKVTLTATDDSDRYIDETLYTSVVTKYTINDGDILTYSGDEGSGPFEITPPVVVKYLSADNYGYDFMGANLETLQVATYGLNQPLSGSVDAGETTSQLFSASAGSTLRIDFSLEESASTQSLRTPYNSSGCVTTLSLKRPDSSVYGEYSYTGGTKEILVIGATEGEWTLEIDRSDCGTAASFEATVNEAPADGNIPGTPSLARILRFLQILTDSDHSGLDTSHDINNDGRIGIAEAIQMLRTIADTE
jgi:hypothetical protein